MMKKVPDIITYLEILMRHITLSLLACSAITLSACSESAKQDMSDAANAAKETVSETASAATEKAATAMESATDTVKETVQDVVSDKVSYTEAPTGTYTIDKGHGYIAFSYWHQGYSRPQLRWRDWDSTLEWNAENPEQSSVSVTINTDNIDTGVDVFDDHLREARWFDATAFPTITFQSTEVTKTSTDKGTITGDLTVKGVTKPVTLDVTYNKAGFDERGQAHKIGFSANTSLMRSEFGIGAGVPSVGDKIDIVIEVEYDEITSE